MKSRVCCTLCFVLICVATTVWADGPKVSPFESNLAFNDDTHQLTVNKAFGDPTDFKASAIAGANYVRSMQSDITEDNAGNGDPDFDLNDGGWNWNTTLLEHTTSASSANLYGVTANGMLQVYKFAPDPQLWIAMTDVADYMVADGAASIRSGADIVFLMQYAALPEIVDPTPYHNTAVAMWTYRLGAHGGTATSFAAYIREARGGGGSWANGIIPWDIAPWCEGLMLMDAAMPGNGYGSDAVACAEVLWQDSFNATPGYYQPHGHSKNYVDGDTNPDYNFYVGGVTGLIRAFEVTNTHTAEIPGLETLLHECQYPDGAFSYHYGASPTSNDRNWQTTAYAVWSLNDNLSATPANLSALYNGGAWLAATQDVSGGWLYGDGTHYPEIGGESTAAVAYAWLAGGAAIEATAAAPDPIGCGLTKDITFSYAPNMATPGMRGYEITFEVTGPVSFDIGDIADAGGLGTVGLHQFYPVANVDGTFTINDALLGTTPGLDVAADLFTVTLTTDSDGPVTVDILSYKLRDPNNVNFFADVTDTGFTVDCTAPDPVTGIIAEPGHNLVDVSWTHDGVDTAVFEVYRGLWYDTTVGVSAYPEYDDLANDVMPTRPDDRDAAVASTEWEWAGTVPVGTVAFQDTWIDHSDRGVYYYEVFAVDAADNGSLAADDNDRSTNYWLGDVDLYNGTVDVGDITVLGATFGWGHGDVGYNNEVDVGPSDDMSGFGIPTTDSLIDFEDLMIFAMNYGNVAKMAPVTGGSAPVLAWTKADDGDWVLELVRPCANLKGLHLTAALPAGVDCRVTGGQLLAEQGDLVFLQNIDRNGLDANLALMGNGQSFSGHGELLRVTVPEDVNLSGAVIKARGLDNADLEGATTSALPSRFIAHANYPNPFNPSTTIGFDLPSRLPVRLTIHSVDGALVRTLVNEVREAGTQSVIWDGRNNAGQTVASGAYFYRISAGSERSSHKMLLMK